jgi:hypothetical protein
MSDFVPDFTRLASVRAKLELSEQIIQAASQKLSAPDLSSSRRAELQRVIEDTRRDVVRWQKQKEDLER